MKSLIILNDMPQFVLWYNHARIDHGHFKREGIMNYIAVDVGGTQLRAALYPETGIEASVIKAIPTKGQGTAVERLLELLESIWPEDQKVERIGLLVPGMVNPAEGMVYITPNIDGWQDLPLVDIVQKRFNTPTVLGNDANLAALGEWKYGAGVGHHNMIYMTVSTGVGSGIIVDDNLLVGAHGIGAELGHVIVQLDGPICGCGKRGHLEAVSSGTGIANFVKRKIAEGRHTILASEEKQITSRLVAEAALQGDELSIEAFNIAGKYLGIAIANLLIVFNPTLIILGGGVIKAGSLLMEPLQRSLEESVVSPRYLSDFRLTTAKLGDQVGLVGALALARG